MKGIVTTNENLYAMHLEIQSLGKGVLGLLLRTQINNFYHKNGIRVNTLTEKITANQKEHCEFEEGKIKMVEDKAVFLEGKTIDMLNEKYKELMEKQITIDI